MASGSSDIGGDHTEGTMEETKLDADRERILKCKTCGQHHSSSCDQTCGTAVNMSKNEALERMIQEEKDKKKMLKEQRRQAKLEAELVTLRGETAGIERDITRTRTTQQLSIQQMYNSPPTVQQTIPAPTARPPTLNSLSAYFNNNRHFVTCPMCESGNMEPQFTWYGILLAIVFFPVGILCCFVLRRRCCGACGSTVNTQKTHMTTPTSSMQPVMDNTQAAAHFDNIGEPVVGRFGACPICQSGTVESHFTWYGIVLAIIFFPFGILCCVVLKRRSCNSCKYTIG